MQTKFYIAALAIIAAFVIGFAPSKIVVNRAAAQNTVSRCTVNDQTGSPLNVRSSPGGKKIVGKLKNGTIVYVENYSGDAKDQSWAEVRLKRSSKTKPLGWVLQDFLVCEEVN